MRRTAERKADRLIGLQIGKARIFAGISRHALGRAIGTTAGKMMRYERGQDRLTASRLALIAEVLDRPLAYFFGAESDPCVQVLKRAFVVSKEDDRNGAWAPEALDLLQRMEVFR